MALVFVRGVMNVLWVAVISFFVLIEKVVPAGRVISRVEVWDFSHGESGCWDKRCSEKRTSPNDRSVYIQLSKTDIP
jgi:hypothetical protein